MMKEKNINEALAKHKENINNAFDDFNAIINSDIFEKLKPDIRLRIGNIAISIKASKDYFDMNLNYSAEDKNKKSPSKKPIN